jgi:23S rRNA pseudouridine955/2504/2580 synthase
MNIIVTQDISSRLDRYIRTLYPLMTQGIIEQSLRNKKIKLNNLKVKANSRLCKNDEIFIDDSLILFKETSTQHNFSSNIISLACKIQKDYLIYEHEDFFAINKPSKLATQGGSKIDLSVDDALNYLNRNNTSTYDNYRLVHRLDKDTSGILLIAKNYTSSIKLTKAFEDKKIKKIYLAILDGILPEKKGEIISKIAKRANYVHEIIGDSDEGKEAITQYRLLKIIDKKFSLVEFMPLTGRTHQLRIHAKSLGCPIVGDAKYGSDIDKNMLLHASSVTLDKSIFGTEISIDVESSNEFKKFIK